MRNLRISSTMLALCSFFLLNGCGQPEAKPELKANPVLQVKATGELVAATSYKASPPSVSQLWQYNIKALAPESSVLKAGDQIVSFDSQTIVEQLSTKTVELQSARQ